MADEHLLAGHQFYSSVDTAYVDEANPTTNYVGADWDLYSSASKTRCGFMTFQLPEKNSLGVSDKAYLYRIKVDFDISVNGGLCQIYPVSSSFTSSMDFQLMTYYTPNREGNHADDKKWNPANPSHMATNDATPIAVGGPRFYDLLSVLGTGIEQFVMEPEEIKLLGYDFGSTVHIAVYNTTASATGIDVSDCAVKIDTKETKPEIATLTSAVTTDGLSANLSVALANDNSITEFYLEAAGSAGIVQRQVEIIFKVIQISMLLKLCQWLLWLRLRKVRINMLEPLQRMTTLPMQLQTEVMRSCCSDQQ